MSSRSRFTISRRAFAGFGALSLAALGLTAVTSTAQATVVKQVVVSASVDGGTATAGVVSTVNISIANASRIDDFHKFTIVLPPGISAPPGKNSPTALGISGGGNWSESVTTCGTVPNCSWLVVGKALLPRSSSKVRPGATLTASIGLVADAPGTLAFKVIHVEDDDFSVLGTPTITVVGGVAGAFCVTDTTPGNIVAGATKTFTVQAIAAGSFVTDASPCTGRKVPYVGPKQVRIHYTSDENPTSLTLINAVAPVVSGDGTAAPVGTSTSKADVTFTFSPSTTGQFTFTARFLTSAHNQSLQATEASPGTVDGNSGGFDVDPGQATGITISSVYDDGNAPLPPLPTPPIPPVALTAGTQFDATFFVTDVFGNVTSAPATSVTLHLVGPAAFSQIGDSTAATVDTEGIVSGKYGSGGVDIPITVTLAASGSVPAATSGPAVLATFTDPNNVSAPFVPGTAGTLSTKNFTPAGTNGNPTCLLDATSPACVSTFLPAGASGTVTLALEDCKTAGATVGLCAGSATDVVAHLTADLKATDGTALYSPTAPATLTYVCAVANCPWDPRHDDPALPIFNSWEESVESFHDFTLHAQDASNTDGKFYDVPACQSLELGDDDVSHHAPTPATSVPGPLKSCVDVTRVLRNTSTGDLSFTILYWDDYKLVP